MAKVTRTPLEKDLRKAYEEAYNDLSSIGNGYGWAAEEVLAVLTPVIKKHECDDEAMIESLRKMIEDFLETTERNA